MRGCRLFQNGDRLVIRPTTGTLGAPLIAAFVIGGALTLAAIRLLMLPAADVQELFSEPMVWFYAALNPLLFAGAVMWYRAARHPIVLDRLTSELEVGSRRTSLAGAVAVVIYSTSTSDSADSFHVEIVFPDAKVRVGRSGWTEETNRTVAERNAARIADFLGLPVDLAVTV